MELLLIQPITNSENDMLKKIIPALCIMTLLAISAQAASPLTADQVERVMAALEQLEPYTDQMDDEREQSGELDADALDPEMFNRECALIFGYSSQTKKIIEAHGFTYKTWPETAGRVMKALAYLSIQEDGNAGAEEMKQALQQIEADPGMSPQQKQAMKQHLQSAMNTIEVMMKAPKEDVEVVRPFFEKYSSEI